MKTIKVPCMPGDFLFLLDYSPRTGLFRPVYWLYRVSAVSIERNGIHISVQNWCKGPHGWVWSTSREYLRAEDVGTRWFLSAKEAKAKLEYSKTLASRHVKKKEERP